MCDVTHNEWECSHHSWQLPSHCSTRPKQASNAIQETLTTIWELGPWGLPAAAAGPHPNRGRLQRSPKP